MSIIFRKLAIDFVLNSLENVFGKIKNPVQKIAEQD
jgi:hypothetical protein